MARRPIPSRLTLKRLEQVMASSTVLYAVRSDKTIVFNNESGNVTIILIRFRKNMKGFPVRSLQYLSHKREWQWWSQAVIRTILSNLQGKKTLRPQL